MPVDALGPEPAVDVFHGVTVLDPYRWLEDRNSAATRQWLLGQKSALDDYFAKLAGMEALRSRVREYLNVEVIEQPAKIGHQFFCRHRRKDQEQACLCVRDLATGAERVLVDPSSLGPYAAVAIERISADGRILAYALKYGGERVEEIHFVDVENGRIFDDHLEKGLLRGLEIGLDNAGFYYCREAEGNQDERSPHEIRYHRFGNPDRIDPILISFPRTGASRLTLLSDSAHLGAAYVHESGSELNTDLYLASYADHKQWRPVFRNESLSDGPFLHHGRVYVLSFSDSPNGQVVALREEEGEESIIVPAWDRPIRGLRPAVDSLYVSYLVDCVTKIHRWGWNGEFLGQLPEQREASFGILGSYTSGPDAPFFTHQSFAEPPSIDELSESADSYVAWKRREPLSKKREYQTQRVSYRSVDGTSIPMWLVELGKPEGNECRPTILTGYGGFGVSMTPRFSALVAIMLELGCVFALPNIRGGSEFGDDWHQAARRRKKQVAFDDFMAAAEWLCAKGITKPDRLAIFGGSNSGLLVAAAMTQRPDLFQAVLCLAPILDMLRYEQFGNARKWRDEYGSVLDEEDFEVLYAYSPYHRVRDEVDYPSTLFVSGDKDTQCDPAHVRKMVARLQDRTAQRRPIVVDYSAERGHTPALPLSVRVDALTRRVAFLSNELGIRIPQGGSE